MYKYLFISLLVFPIGLIFGQQTLDTKEDSATYNRQELFKPFFYTQNGNSYRSASGIPGPEYWQNEADYTIKISLDETKKTVKGTIVIQYTNNSPDELNFLWLQLDQNLFKPDSRGEKTIPSEGSRFGSRGKKITNGGYTIDNLQVSGKTFTSIVEDTRMQIRLDKPLAANGGKTNISLDFSFIIPENGSDRMGYVSTKNGIIYSIAEWFPRMSVYDDVKGWNTKPYLGAGEFYCEYGDVNLEITVPENHIVLASGELMNPSKVFSKEVATRWAKAKKSDEVIEIIKATEVKESIISKVTGTKTWVFKMENTRDVAWASSPAFVVDAVRINLPSGKKSLAVSAQPIESNGTLAYGRAAEYVKGSVEFYSTYLSEYPYPMAVNIASNVHGMEYPGIVFCNWLSMGESVWNVIDHEFGHIWFPMIVGSDERSFAWMDEGFNTFINEMSSKNFNSGEYYRGGILPTSRMASRLGEKGEDYILLAPDAIEEKNMGIQLYYKPAMGLQILRDIVLGEERFDYAFRQYVQAWSYKHPTPFDFFRTIENASGEDLSWFWRAWFFNNYELDQSITNVEKIENGYSVEVTNRKEMALPIILEARTSSGKIIPYKQAVDVWMKNNSWTIFIETKEALESVTLDPKGYYPDTNRENSRWVQTKE